MKRSEGLSPKIKFVKSSCWDWFVAYRDGDDPKMEVMSVFGVMTPEEALAEARIPLGSDGDYEIITLTRADAA